MSVFFNELLTVSVATLDLLIRSLLVLHFSSSPKTSNDGKSSRDIFKLSVRVKCTSGANVKWFVIVCVQTQGKKAALCM